MATVLPLRPSTNSSGSNSARQPSTSSFPSQTSGSHSGHDDRTLSPHNPYGHHHSQSAASQPSSGRSVTSLSYAAPNRPAPTVPVPGRKQKPVKSQYPPYSNEKHVEYILVASFDIDRGSVMEHQYPGPVGGDEHMLAELMLPDQTHMRSQDWTIFFLHKDAPADDEEREAKLERRRQRREWQRSQLPAGSQANGDGHDEDEDDDDSSDEDVTQVDGPPLVYVLNLVNTKQDNTVKRGAIVKAMAICTRHSFLHIYKPLLLLALEQYFASPGMDTLASLYEAVNNMDLSLMPKLTTFEKHILQCSETKDLFIEKFEAIIAQRMASTGGQDAALTSSPNPQMPARKRYGLPRDTHEFETVVNYANVPVPIKVPTALSPETVGDFSLIKLITTFNTPHQTSPTPFNPTHPHLTTNGPLTHPMIVLLNALLTQKRVIFIGHNLPSSEVAEAVLAACSLASGGLLRGFTRHAFPYTDLTKIDDLLKVPGFIAGVTNPAFAHKNEWWDLLCDLQTGRMKISTKIEQAPPSEGVAFFQQPNNIATITGTASGMSAIAAAGASLTASIGGHGSNAADATGDNAFMAGVLMAINERHGENAIRSKFRRWILNFTRLAAAFEETVFGASALQIQTSPKLPLSADSPGFGSFGSVGTPSKTGDNEPATDVTGHGYVWSNSILKATELAANATRIEGWRNTRTYYNFIQDLATFYVHRPVKTIDLQHLHDKIAKLRLGHEQSAHIYSAICNAVYTDQEISELLSIIASGVWTSASSDSKSSGAAQPQQQQGLFYLALGLFHPRSDIRHSVADLMDRIREHEGGGHFFNSAGRFAKMALERVRQSKDWHKAEDDVVLP